ncbi:MAG: HAD family hydrolase [Chloroflexota bacterium]|nr:HAD family hydrolase [Chloroflexota bacterium]
MVSVTKMVRLAVVDVDGCLTPGEAGDWNWEALQTLCGLNRQARQGEDVPAVTLCTGRQEPYVEVLMQAIGAYLPGIYENGCGLYFPNGYRFIEHPSITPQVQEALAAVKATLHRQVVTPGLGYFQPGKEASLTLYPLPGTSVGHLRQAVADALAGHDNVFTVQTSVSCVDVIPAGIDKGVGIRWLSQETGIPLAHMGGIGDSTSDLRFLRLVGQSAAPANATAEVKTIVGYISPHEDGDGVVDILRRWYNKAAC